MNRKPPAIKWDATLPKLRFRVEEFGLEAAVAKWLRSQKNSHLLIACSGGADSVFLLCALTAMREVLDLKLTVAHYNHDWRGVDSDEDAAFVESLASAFELPFYLEKRPSTRSAFTETTAREIRLQFLRRVARETGCDAIAYGHQLDDVLETQLQRLARGVGSEGLAAPRPVSLFERYVPHLRPFLHLRSIEIQITLNALGIFWREDKSNADQEIPRNALRHAIIPDIELALNRDVSAGAARSRRLLEEDAVALALVAKERIPEAYESPAKPLPRKGLEAKPAALIRRALTVWLSNSEVLSSVSGRALQQLIDAIESDRPDFRMSAGSSFIVLSKDRLSIDRPAVPMNEAVTTPQIQPSYLTPEGGVILNGNASLSLDTVFLSDALLTEIRTGDIDPRVEAYICAIADPVFEVRSYQPGDRFTPINAPGSKLVSDWFADRKILPVERRQLPLVIASSGQIVWIPGFAPADAYKLQPGMKQAFRLTYQNSKTL